MSTMTSLRDIANGDPVDATDPQFNFQTIERFIDSDVVTVDGSKGFTGPVAGVTATDPTHLATLAQVGAAVPVGTVTMFAGSTLPTGWAWCRGASVSQTDPNYVDLYAVIGVTYGDPGGGNFNLPDFRDRSPMGSGGTQVALGATTGETDWEAPQHSHTINHGHGDNFSIASDSHSHTMDHDHPAGTTGSDSHTHTASSSPGTNFVFRPGSATGFGVFGGSTHYFQDGFSSITTDSDSHSHSFSVAKYSGSTGPDSHTHTLNGSVTSHSGSSGPSGTSTTVANRNIHPVLGINFIIKL